MPARKDDDDRKPPESGRKAAIWRLPTSQGRGDGPPRAEGDRPRKRGVPLPVAAGLAAALVAVGLYAAWETVGQDIWSTQAEPEAAAEPAQAAPEVARGGGPEDGGAASPPTGDAQAAPPAVAEEGSDSGEPTVAGSAAGVPDAADSTSPEAVVTAVAADADATAAAAPAPQPAEAPPPSPPLAGDGPHTPPTAAAAAATPAAAHADALAALAARLAALEAHAAGAGAAMTALAKRVRALEDDPARMELDRALAEWNERRALQEAALAEIGARLAQLEAEAGRRADTDGRLVALVLVTGDLAAALGSSGGFAPTLDIVRGIAGEDREIDGVLARLAPFAARGVMTLDGLRARFPDAATALVRTAPADADADWIDETVTRLSQLVTVRRTGGALNPASVDGRLAEAGAALAAGDLTRAIAIVAPLAEGAAQATSAQAWLRDARARREADDALATLVATVRARIGARWAVTGPSP